MSDDKKTLNRKADAGWADMARILERELPVQRRRRWPLAWLWLAGLAAFFGIGAAALWQLRSQRTAPETTAPMQRPVAETSVEKTRPELDSPQKQTVFAQNEQRLPVLPFHNEPSKRSETALPNEEKTAVVPVFEPDFERSKTTEPTVFEATKSEPRAARQAFSMPRTAELRSLPSLVFGGAVSMSRPKKAADLSFQNIRKPRRRASFGLHLAAQTLDFGRLSGFSAGFFIEKKTSSRWSVESGLFWNHERRSESPSSATGFSIQMPASEYLAATGDTALAFATPSQSTVGSSSGPNSVGTGFVDVSANVFDRIELPVQARFRLAERWSASAGGSLACRIGAKSKLAGSYFSSKSFQDLNNSYAADESLRSSASVNSSLDQGLPRLDARLTASIARDLSSKWRAELRFEQGLLSQNAPQIGSKRNHFWRFGLTRRF